MKYSIIIPIYNVETYLRQCVDSVLMQNYPSFEIILVDDGSPDKCPEICDEYAGKDSRIKVIHKSNGGSSDARNIGIDAAIGDYILFVDSDDYWNSNDVLSQIDAILDAYDVDIVQFGHEKLYNREQRIATGPKRNLSQCNGSTTKDIIGDLVCTERLTIAAYSMAISRGFIIKNNLYFTKCIKTEDLEWAVRLYLCEPRWAFSDEYFYVYRTQRENSITATIDYKHLCDYCWILEHCIPMVENSAEYMQFPLLSYLMYHVLIVSAFTFKLNLPTEHRKNIISRIKALCKARLNKYTLCKKVKMANMVYRVGGYGLMARVLAFYLKNRGR